MKAIRSLAVKAVVVLCLFVSMPAFAGTLAGPLTVTSLTVNEQRYTVTFTELYFESPPCYSMAGDRYYVDFAHPGAKEMYATLLAAFLSSKKVYMVWENVCTSFGGVQEGLMSSVMIVN